MLSIKNISKAFGRKTIIKNLSFDFENETYGILGPNGAGKSTLIRCITGVYGTSGGEVLVNGSAASKCYINKNDFAIGYLPQRFGLFKELKLCEMMRYFATQRGIDAARQKAEIEKVIEIVNLTEHIDKKVSALSGGMLRRAGIAQSLLGDPPCIVLDEPTAGLDPEECMRFRTVIANIKKERTILISTHIVEDVETTCDKILVMNNGQFVFSGTAQQLCERAADKVYSVAKNDLVKLSGDYVIEKESLINDVYTVRVITGEEQNMENDIPTIEDGYFCCLKNI